MALSQISMPSYVICFSRIKMLKNHFGSFLLECFYRHFEFHLLILVSVMFQVSWRTRYLLKHPINKNLELGDLGGYSIGAPRPSILLRTRC